MSNMKNLHQDLTEKNIDPEPWQEAFDAESDFCDYVLARDVATHLGYGDGVTPFFDTGEAIEVAQKRWPLAA